MVTRWITGRCLSFKIVLEIPSGRTSCWEVKRALDQGIKDGNLQVNGRKLTVLVDCEPAEKRTRGQIAALLAALEAKGIIGLIPDWKAATVFHAEEELRLVWLARKTDKEWKVNQDQLIKAGAPTAEELKQAVAERPWA